MNKSDTELHLLLNNHRNGYFVELGAFDGLKQSNTKFLEAYKGWTGVLVEPNPQQVFLCRLSRKKTTVVVCAACVPFEFEKDQITFKSLSTMSFSNDLKLEVGNLELHEEAARRHLRIASEETFSALAIPLGQILGNIDAPKEIDFLSIDVEGAEIDVLRGVDLTDFKVKFISVESRNILDLTEYLSTFGYSLKLQFSHSDFLFERV